MNNNVFDFKSDYVKEIRVQNQIKILINEMKWSWHIILWVKVYIANQFSYFQLHHWSHTNISTDFESGQNSLNHRAYLTIYTWTLHRRRLLIFYTDLHQYLIWNSIASLFCHLFCWIYFTKSTDVAYNAHLSGFLTVMLVRQF